MRRLPACLAAAMLLTSCGGHPTAASAPPPTRQAPPARDTAPPRHHGPSDGYAVTQLGGLRLFSRRLGRARFVLTQQRLPGGRPRRAPGVRAAPMPFQVDLGTDAAGREVAVYTRCHLVRSLADGSVTPVHCVPALWDPDRGVERRLHALAAPRQSAMWPSIDHGRIAFARRGDDPDHVTVWQAPTPSAAPHRLARLPLYDVAGLQLRRGLVALTGSSVAERFGHGGDGSEPVLLLGDRAAPVEQIGEGGLGEETDLEPRGLTFIGDEVVWAIGDLSGEDDVGRSSVQRYDLRTGSLVSAHVRGAITGLAGTSIEGLVAAEAEPAETRQGAVPAHARLRPLPRLRYAPVDREGTLGDGVRAP